jgi:hypothetical protein
VLSVIFFASQNSAMAIESRHHWGNRQIEVELVARCGGNRRSQGEADWRARRDRKVERQA